MSLRSKLILSSLLLVTGLCSCVEVDEGCLDPLASNYEVAADRDCCCTYPSLSVSVLHRLDSLGLQLGDYDIDERLDIGGFVITLSQIELQTTEDTWLSVSETENIRLGSGITAETLMTPSYNLITSSLNNRVNLGSLQNGDDISAVRFRVGLPSSWAALNLASIDTEEHHLQDLVELYNSDDRNYTEMLLRYRRDTLEPYIPLTWTIAEGMEEQLVIELPLDILRGDDLTIGLILDYKELLDDVNPSDAVDVQRSRVLSNLADSWSAMRF